MAARSLLLAALVAPALALSACTTVSPEAKVRAGLIEAGLPDHLAGCMAEKMVDRLSIAQLRQLKSLASVKDADYHKMTVDRFLHKLRGINDPEIFAVTSRAALSCAITG